MGPKMGHQLGFKLRLHTIKVGTYQVPTWSKFKCILGSPISSILSIVEYFKRWGLSKLICNCFYVMSRNGSQCMKHTWRLISTLVRDTIPNVPCFASVLVQAHDPRLPRLRCGLPRELLIWHRDMARLPWDKHGPALDPRLLKVCTINTIGNSTTKTLATE